jgi:16S rRNA G1207 methylase RsmC
MSARDGVSEKLLLGVLASEFGQQAQLEDASAARILLIGMQSAATVAAVNALAGAERVELFHLDQAAETLMNGLGNRAWMLGDALGDAPGAGGLPLGQFRVVGLNVEAAKSYRLLRDVIAQAARLVHLDGTLLVAGPKKGGAEAAVDPLRQHFETVQLELYRKGHRVYRASGLRPTVAAADSDDPTGPTPAEPSPSTSPGTRPVTSPVSGRAPIIEVHLRGQTVRLVQDDRIFARGQVDAATRMLANVFEVPPGAEVLDLGCGGGVLGILAALLEPTARCTLADADPLAVAAARQGAALSGAANVTVHLSDVLAGLPDQTFNLIVMNPPFHRGRTQDRGLAERFLAGASAALRPGGRLWVVCNRFLPYERTLTQLLGAVREVAGDRSYKVLLAERPEMPRP